MSAPYRPPTVRKHGEDDLQRDIFQFLRVALPPNAIAYHVANGGLRSKRQAARLVGLGVVAGIPDIGIIWSGTACFIELKAGRGVVSAAQRETMKKLHYCGASVAVCRSVDEVDTFLRQVGMPLRAHRVAL
jgi:hypothetical protein